jgi:hypothetical protein
VFDLDPSYSVLDHFEAVKGHVVGNVTRFAGRAIGIQAELRFDDGISNRDTTDAARNSSDIEAYIFGESHAEPRQADS